MKFKKYLLIVLCSICCLQVFASVDDIQKVAAKGTVALTFDDGPSPIYTPQVLAILKKYNIKATFFLIGQNAKKYPELVKEILAEGHVVGSHSQTHAKLTKISAAQLHTEIVEPQIIINNIIGKKPICLRYPYGMANQQVKDAIRAQGMAPISMGFNSFDYDQKGVDKLVPWVLKNAYSGQVFLFHDKFQQTVEGLPLIIEGIKKKGLGFSQICMDPIQTATVETTPTDASATVISGVK